jgi:hypothetical protein
MSSYCLIHSSGQGPQGWKLVVDELERQPCCGGLIGSMFIWVNSKCARQVRPPLRRRIQRPAVGMNRASIASSRPRTSKPVALVITTVAIEDSGYSRIMQ